MHTRATCHLRPNRRKPVRANGQRKRSSGSTAVQNFFYERYSIDRLRELAARRYTGPDVLPEYLPPKDSKKFMSGTLLGGGKGIKIHGEWHRSLMLQTFEGPSSLNPWRGQIPGGFVSGFRHFLMHQEDEISSAGNPGIAGLGFWRGKLQTLPRSESLPKGSQPFGVQIFAINDSSIVSDLNSLVRSLGIQD